VPHIKRVKQQVTSRKRAAKSIILKYRRKFSKGGGDPNSRQGDYFSRSLIRTLGHNQSRQRDCRDQCARETSTRIRSRRGALRTRFPAFLLTRRLLSSFTCAHACVASSRGRRRHANCFLPVGTINRWPARRKRCRDAWTGTRVASALVSGAKRVHVARPRAKFSKAYIGDPEEDLSRPYSAGSGSVACRRVSRGRVDASGENPPSADLERNPFFFFTPRVVIPRVLARSLALSVFPTAGS